MVASDIVPVHPVLVHVVKHRQAGFWGTVYVVLGVVRLGALVVACEAPGLIEINRASVTNLQN